MKNIPDVRDFDSYGPLYTALTTGAKLNKKNHSEFFSLSVLYRFLRIPDHFLKLATPSFRCLDKCSTIESKWLCRRSSILIIRWYPWVLIGLRNHLSFLTV